MAHKKWIIADADKEKASVLSEKLNIDPMVAFLLVSRGFDDELTASAFIFGEGAFSSPFSFKDMDKAVSRINFALDNNERICIYGDYDCDGVTATALLYSFFESMGADVIYYIPDRLKEGYGMNNRAVDFIKSQGADLIVTVDNGISAVGAADYIYSSGMELVITDHHLPGDVLPKAEAVIDPHRKDNELRFRDYSGVGVAFKLACALYGDDTQELLEQYADLVAVGTIGDVVSLKNENRSLVKAGLEMLNADSRIGLTALKKAAGNDGGELTAVDAAFQLCPRINAAGRMDHASKAVELLISDDWEDATFKAQQLNTENAHRHEVEQNILADIAETVKNNPSLINTPVIVIEGRDYHTGVIGIVASHIMSKYGKPAIIISVDSSSGECTGSARSVEGFNIFEAVSACSDLLLRFGGHPLAAGLALKAESISAFREKINMHARTAYETMPVETLRLDCKISPFYLDTDLVDSIQALEPFGADNMPPFFCLSNMVLESVTSIGDGKHIRIEASKKGRSFRIVKFRTSLQTFPYKKGDHIDLAVRITKNLYKGRYYLSIQAIDVRRNGIDDDKYFAQKVEYEKFLSGEIGAAQLYPDRGVCSVIYRFLKQNSDVSYSADDLYFALGQRVSYGQLVFALEAFAECGIITKNDTVTVNEFSGKANLENTKVLRNLKERV